MNRFFLPLVLPVLIMAGCTSQDVAPADKAAFIMPSDLAAFGYMNPKMPEGTWSKTYFGKGEYDIDYEVETPESEEKYILYLNETLSNEKGASDAITSLATTRGVLNLTLKSQGLTEKALPNQTIYGDGSSLTTLQKDNIVVGNVFSARKGGRSFSLMIVGIVFENAKDWDDFAGKKVNAWLDGVK